ncbi:MAG: hypothetical protein ISS44_03620 [Candidatus Omnitrophica bacterium]|nr:hypothetical protein [Candidatus Omnitrophota bacterium]
MAQKVLKLRLKREKNYLYYLDKDGDVSAAKMARGKAKGGKPKKVTKCGISKKVGYLYFIDKQGDVSCAKMKKGGTKKKKKAKKRKK